MTIIQIIGFFRTKKWRKQRVSCQRNDRKNSRTERHDFPGWASRWVKSTTDKEKFLNFPKRRAKSGHWSLSRNQNGIKVLKTIVEAENKDKEDLVFEEKGFST